MSKITYLKAADGREIGVVDNRIAFVMDEVEDGLFIVTSLGPERPSFWS
jgi:hypothetical protein